MLTAERLCSYIVRLLHVPVHLYSNSGEQVPLDIDCHEPQDVFTCDPELLQLLLSRGNPEYPALYLEAETIVYGVVLGEANTYILGPCCLGSDTTASARHLIRSHHMDTGKPYPLRAMQLSDFSNLLLMLFETVTGIRMETHELYLKCFCNQDFESALKGRAHQILYTIQETGVIHNPYDQELREQGSIRAGDLDALYRSFQETYAGQIGRLSRDPLRQAQNLAIVLITLASRSAIAGGLLPEVAFSMSDAFIQRAEEMKHEGEAYAVGYQAEIEFCTAVQNLPAAYSRQKPLITRCKQLIIQQLHSKLTVQALSRQLGISPGYLSHLFIKEERMKLTDFIAQEKIRAAQNQLVYTDDTFDAIAFSLGFASQSHFGRTFKHWTEMTPKQYRELYGQHLQK